MGNKLPSNWAETELGNYVYLKNGFAYKTSQFKNTGIPILKISNIIRNGRVDISNPQFVSESDLNPSFLVSKGDIVIAMSGATTGKFGIYEGDRLLLQNQRVGNIKLRSEIHGNKRFVYYLIGYLKKEIGERAYGGAQPNISPALIESIKIPLPPLAEQERIVAKLDALFVQHEALKNALERIPKLLKNFRQQVLTQAVTGKLTEEWRVNKLIEEWLDLEIFDLVKDFKKDVRTGPFGSSLAKSEHQSEGLPVWGIESIGLNGKFTGKNKIYISEKKAKDLQSFRVKGGDIIISRSGTVGELCIVPESYNDGFISTNLLKIVLDHSVVDSLFFCWMFKANPKLLSELKELCKGSTRLFITQNILKSLVFQLPPLLEQQEIVSRVESMFAKADKIEEKYKMLKSKIDALPQAILHKAFKGELVPQLPTDSDAKELLREIKKLKIK